MHLASPTKEGPRLRAGVFRVAPTTLAITREFTPEELDALDVGPWSCVASWVVDERRWDIVKAVVFEHEGVHWQVEYFDPATEMQEGQDVWNDQETVMAVQVERRQVTVERWVPVE